MLARLQSAFQRQQQFTADASHELRTPVAVLLAQSECALFGGDSLDEHRQALVACQRAGKRMQSLIEGLLTLARCDAGNVLSERREVDLAEVVKSSVRMLAPTAEEKNISVTSDLQPAQVMGDANRLSQVVVNLVQHAIIYNKPGGQVRVKLHSADQNVSLAITDTGIGIAADHLPHIYDRFYRVDPSRSEQGAASGLGLAITQEIIHAHGGHIEVLSQPGVGSTFAVHLPAMPESPAPRNHTDHATKGASSDNPDSS